MRWLIGLCCLFISFTSQAHTQSVSYSTWNLGTETTLRFRISHLELNRLGLHPAQRQFAEQVLENTATWFKLPSDCQLNQSQWTASTPGWAQVKLIWRCDQMPTRLEMTSIFEKIPYHTHLAAIDLKTGSIVQTQFNSEQFFWTATESGIATEFKSMFGFGLFHILTGWDHLIFLLALLLGTAQIPRLIVLLTGFTIGHSASLATQVLGFVAPSTQMVEWVIALSILLVAIQNTWRVADYKGHWPYPLFAAIMFLGWVSGSLSLTVTLGLCLFGLCHLLWQKSSMSWLVTAALGLFHGFGFAGLLANLQLPIKEAMMPLLAFNLGVEAGQVLVILITLPLLVWLRRSIQNTYSWLNAIAAATATFWLITRTF